MVRKRRFVLVVALLFALAALSLPASAATPSPSGRSESIFSNAVETTHSIWFNWLDWVKSWAKAGAGMDPDGAPAEAGAGMDPDGTPVEAGAGMDSDGTPVEAGAGMDPDGNN